MTARRLALVAALLVAAGGVVAALWIRSTGTEVFLDGLSRVRAPFAVALPALTAACLLARFVRWQFLLRRMGVRLPARPSLSIYLASLVGIATPAYLGELVRGVLVRRRFGVPFRVTTAALVVERLFDVAALGLLGLIGALAGGAGASAAVLGGLVLVAGVALWVGRALAAPLRLPPATLDEVLRPAPAARALVLSVAAWLPPMLLVTLAAASLDLSVPPLASARIFSTATLLGALTLMPAGVGTTGSLAIFDLRGLGLSLADGVAVVTLVRTTTAGVTLLAAAVFLVRELRSRRPAPATADEGAGQHFDDIAQEYEEQFSEHVWNHLLARKMDMLAAALPPPEEAGPGVDLGCGLGRQCLDLRGRGFSVVGIDLSAGLVRQAARAGAPAAVASALELPLRDESVGFAYAVGSLHHLPGVEAQERAFAEVRRVLRPGGRLLVHESNPRNPLFRFYMGYVFPILKTIDEGTEWWIPTERWSTLPDLEVERVEYFTFLPDFLPRALLPPFARLERRLERSRLRNWSVHYLVVLRSTRRATRGCGTC